MTSWKHWVIPVIIGEIIISATLGPWTMDGTHEASMVPVFASVVLIVLCAVGLQVARSRAALRTRALAMGATSATVVGGDSSLTSAPARRLDRLPTEPFARGPAIAAIIIFVVIFGLIAWGAATAIPAGSPQKPWVVGALVGMLGLIVILLIRRTQVAAIGGARYDRWAIARGWSYRESVPPLSDLWEASPFGRSGVRDFRRAVTGTMGDRLAGAGIYASEALEGVETSLRNLSCAFVCLDRRLPAVDIVPRDIADGIEIAFGGADIQVESAEFNARWRVVSARPEFAHAIVHPRLMTRLLADDAKGRRLRIEGETVLAWEPGVAGLRDLEDRLLLASDLADLIPAHVLKQYGDEPRAELLSLMTPPR